MDKVDKAFENDLMIRAAFGEEVERVPVFLHRQAGRHLPEYNELKEGRDFFELCQTPELASEITLQPVLRYRVDAAIIFSDILTIPQALGFKISMLPKLGPVFEEPLVMKNIDKINFDIDLSKQLKYVYDAITLTVATLNSEIPLIGFSGGPWTLLAYMFEGKSSKSLTKAKRLLFESPEKAKNLLFNLSKLIISHLENQILAGARIVEIFDTLVGELGQNEITHFVIPALKFIVSSLKTKIANNIIPRVPIIVFPKGANHSLFQIAFETECDVLAVDWNVSPKTARQIVGHGVTLMGNLDPCALYSENEAIVRKTTEMVRAFGRRRYIANLGHGVLPDFEVEKVRAFVEAVKGCEFD